MHRIAIHKTGSLAGTSDLTVLAPIRQGFVPALDAVTYKTRVKRVLATLHAGRRSAHEFELVRALSDAVERVGRIHAVRIAVLEPQNQVLLAATFDGALDAYVRVIWQKVARLLDLIYCNTDGYRMGWTSRYDEWGQWLTEHQVETAFLYATPEHSSADTRWLRLLERLQRQTPDHELGASRLQVPSAETAAYTLYSRGQDTGNLGLDDALNPDTEAKPLVFRQGMRALAGLYRLADLYAPGTEDGLVLHRAAQELLPEFCRLVEGEDRLDRGLERAGKRFSEPLNWLLGLAPIQPARSVPSLPARPPVNNPEQIQAGILQPYPPGDHGLVLLMAFRSRVALAAFLAEFTPNRHAEHDQFKVGDVVKNLAFTVQGLRLAGLSDEEVQRFPQDFTEGMAARAGLLGDVRVNHPARWRWPAANWHLQDQAPDLPEQAEEPRISPDAVHAVLTLRLLSDAKAPVEPVSSARRCILASISTAVSAHADIVPLSLQWTQRLRAPAPPGQSAPTREHFGYLDNQSDPVFDRSDAGKLFNNQVHLGEALLGYANAAEEAPPAVSDFAGRLMPNGSFLVLRKLRQDVDALNEVLARAVNVDDGQPAPLSAADLMGYMMGRWPLASGANAGEPLGATRLPGGAPNDFVFQDSRSPASVICPLHAHVRRANPRSTPAPGLEADAQLGSRPPRLFRRGMSYGPIQEPSSADEQHPPTGQPPERGLMFLAYNASIGEQFEVVQRWLSGGNSTGGFSGQSDPLLGVADAGRQRVFRFDHAGRTLRLSLDGDPNLLAEPKPLVRLEWGLYAFAPSLGALAMLAERAVLPNWVAERPWSEADGERQIQTLQRIEREQGAATAKLAWKAALEDGEDWLEYRTASVWAAIRAQHGGALRTPYGVLIASRELVDQVLAPSPVLTATGYLPRMHRSIGAIHLGLDDHGSGSAYALMSAACNQAIQQIGLHDAEALARLAVEDKLGELAKDTERDAVEDEAIRGIAPGRQPRPPQPWSLTFDVRELIDEVLARACEAWFGLDKAPDLFKRGGFRWTWKEDELPSYPGHWMAPSRYIFQPHPEGTAEDLGARHGAAARAAMFKFIQSAGAVVQAPITRQVLDTPPGVHDTDMAARTLTGAIMGFVPTIDGNLRRVLNDWLREGSFWSLRAELTQAASAAERQSAEQRVWAAFRQTMQARAAPDMLWRTAVVAHDIARADGRPSIRLQPGDVVVVGLASATQQSLVEGRDELSHAFGGHRGTGGPTHACPGYSAALALMRGMVLALLSSPMPLRPGPGPLTLTVDGLPDSPTPDATADFTPMDEAFDDFKRGTGDPDRLGGVALMAGAGSRSLLLHGMAPSLALAAGSAIHTRVWAMGDSWLADLPWSDTVPDLQAALRQRGVAVSRAFASKGRTLAGMATDAALHEVSLALASLDAADRPKALLIGAGGNDITQMTGQPSAPQTPLGQMLNAHGADVDQAWNEQAVTEFIDGHLAGLYRKLLDKLQGVTSLPMFVHGYDHPIPDGRAFWVTDPLIGLRFKAGGPWLKQEFLRQQIEDVKVQRQIMRRLIDRLNAMIATVAGQYHGKVIHLDLTGVLAAQADFGDSSDNADNGYQRYWDNELHPSAAGYGLLAEVVARKLALLP